MTIEEIIEELEELADAMWKDYEDTQFDALLFYQDEIRELIKEIEQ